MQTHVLSPLLTVGASWWWSWGSWCWAYPPPAPATPPYRTSGCGATHRWVFLDIIIISIKSIHGHDHLLTISNNCLKNHNDLIESSRLLYNFNFQACVLLNYDSLCTHVISWILILRDCKVAAELCLTLCVTTNTGSHCTVHCTVQPCPVL